MLRFPQKTRTRVRTCAAVLLLGVGMAHAAEHITLRNGFDLICDHREVAGDRVRLYMTATGTNFTEVSNADIVSSEFVALPAAKPPVPAVAAQAASQPIDPTPAEIREMVA